MKYTINIILLILAFIYFGCNDNTNVNQDNHKQGAIDAHGHDHGSEDNKNTTKGTDNHDQTNEVAGEVHHEDGIHLNKRQVEAIGLELGDFSEIKISDYIKATGTLGLPPDAYSTVSPKTEGFIKKAKKYVEGSSVKKGAVIAYLENPVLIEKQEMYLSVNAELNYLQQEYNRQKLLFDQNAGIEKTVQRLKADLDMKKAQKLGSEKYLKYLNINTDNILAGQFIQRIPIIAPISGFITSIDMHNGMFVSPQQQLMEIVSDHHLHLELNVFEKDIAHIEEEQKITYIVPALGNETYDGEVHVIGKEFDTANKTVRIHGHLEGKKPKFIKDLFISAKIWLNDKKVMALPSESVMKDEDVSFIYYTSSKMDDKEMQFLKAMVIPGAIEEGFISIKMIDELPKESKIVTKGAYFIFAQSKYGQAAHVH